MTKCNVYRSNGQWCYALFIGGEFDHSDVVDVAPSATFTEVAIAIRKAMPVTMEGVEATRVADV